MQEEFIQQYKCIEDLTQRCYPGAQISLDFTINDVLEYFSDIARSHWIDWCILLIVFLCNKSTNLALVFIILLKDDYFTSAPIWRL